MEVSHEIVLRVTRLPGGNDDFAASLAALLGLWHELGLTEGVSSVAVYECRNGLPFAGPLFEEPAWPSGR